VPAVRRRDVTMARRPKPARTSHSPLVTRRFSRLKIEPVVTSKCTSGRPLLIDSAPPIEFRVTHSKQTTEKFLTEARTHIRIFNFSPFTTQNPTQLIQLLQRNPNKIPKTVPPENATVSAFLSRRFTRASLRFHALPASKPVPSAPLLPGSAQNVENDVTSTKQTTENSLPGATTTSSLSRKIAAFKTQNPAQLIHHCGVKNLSRSVQVRRRQPFLIPGRAPLTLFAGWANMARTS
jgi:hypothetical protein